MSNQKSTPMGRVRFRDRNDLFGIRAIDRLRHLLILGQTGTGKSTLIETMARFDMAMGAGVAVLDPHGDLIERLLDFIPCNRIADTVYLNPIDASHAFSFNPLAEGTPGERERSISAIIAAFQKTWPDFWGPRSEHLLRMALLALSEFHGMDFSDLSRFISDPSWRTRLAAKLNDDVVKTFWLREFAALPERLASDSLSPLQNKVGALVGNPILRRILCQPRTRLRLENILAKGKILLVNLSRGQMGMDASVLLGSLLLAMLEFAVLSRADLNEAERKPFYLFVDEFSMFASPGFVALLSEGRKYGLGVTLAQQSLASLLPSLQADILTNSGSLVCFRLGAIDANLISPNLQPVFRTENLMALAAHNFVIRLLIDGHPAPPFTAETLPPSESGPKTGNRESAIDESRKRHCKPSGP